jgi:hypothetical protein
MEGLPGAVALICRDKPWSATDEDSFKNVSDPLRFRERLSSRRGPVLLCRQ